MLSAATVQTTGHNLDFGSKSDLWDISNGTEVKKVSGQANFSFDPRNIFGGRTPNSDGNPTFIFEDGRPSGYVHYVEWRTPTPVSVSAIELRGQGDGPAFLNGREFDRFRLFVKSPGSTTFDQLVYDYQPTHPYNLQDSDTRLIVSAILPNVLAQDFRAEFVDTGVRFWSAPRIWELDGFGPPFDFGTKDDLWDTRQGSTVTRISGQADQSFRPENMFGANFPNPDGATTFTFQDGQPAGYLHFIEWKTPSPVQVRSFKLHAQGDGPDFLNGREYDRFRLLAKSVGAEAFDKVLYDYVPSHPYAFEEFDSRLTVSGTVAGYLAQEFRAEFIDTGVRFWSAPRIFELDGFSDPITKPMTALVALELTWETKLGKSYQIEWREELPGSQWKAYGAPFDGTGSPSSMLVSTRDQGARFFRLVELR